MQNEQCVFAHDFTEYYALDDASLARRDYDSEDEEDDSAHLDFQAEDMFPSLQGAGANSSSPAQANASSSDLSMNFARAVSLPTPPGPSSMTAGFTAGGGGYGLYRSLPSRVPAPPPPLPSARALYRRSSANGAQINKWVSTGDSVAAQYLELREQAYQMACARNKCFMGATQAYRKYVHAMCGLCGVYEMTCLYVVSVFALIAATRRWPSRCRRRDTTTTPR